MKRPGHRPAAPPRAPTESARELIKAAKEVIEAEGESGLRVTEVAKRAGYTVAVIYQCFGDREGLVEAARAEQFDQWLGQDIEYIARALEESTTFEECRERLRKLSRVVANADRRDARWMRLDILGSARRRPGLAERLAPFQTEKTQRLAQAIEMGKSRGFVRPTVDAHTMAVFVQAFTLGRIVGDIATQDIDVEQWCLLVDTIMDTVVWAA